MTKIAFATSDARTSVSVAAHQLQIGLKLAGAGLSHEAMAVFARGLAAAEKAPPGTESIETISQLHAKLADAAVRCGEFNLAHRNYRAALRMAPHLTNCWCSFADLHLRCGEHQKAIDLYLQALKLNPRHWAARANMVHALMA